MYSMNTRLIYAIFLCFLFSSCSWFGSTNVERLRCEGEINLQGIDMTTPRLSWEITSGKRDVRQTTYIILVASSLEKLNKNEGDLWDSGEVKSDQSIWIPYEGKPLTSGMECFWKVKITTDKGESKWSEPALRFEGSGRMRHFGFPKLLAQLEIVYETGNRQTIVSDPTWKITPYGPIRANNEFDGEVYDAREQLTGWTKNGYDEGHWLPVELVEAPKGRLSAQINRNMKIMETLQPVSINEIKARTYILDMGQNMVGWLQMKVSANEGDTIRLRFAERLKVRGESKTGSSVGILPFL